jgi:hypothetical protein
VVDKQQQIEMIGKVFVVTCGIRRCLICDRVFTPTRAANHATNLCYPLSAGSEQDEDTLDPCSSFLRLTESSCSPGRA